MKWIYGLLAFVLVLGSVNATQTPWGVIITAPEEKYHQMHGGFVPSYFAVIRYNQQPVLNWTNRLMQKWFTVRVEQEEWNEVWNDGHWHWINHPAIDLTWKLSGGIRTLSIPRPWWNAMFYNDSFMNVTMCNDYAQCNKITIYNGNWLYP